MRVFSLPDVSWDGFVKCQIRQAVLTVETRGSQVNPESPRDLAVDRSGTAVCTGRARLFFGRQPLYLHIGIHDLIERERHLCADPIEAILNERHDFGTARIPVGELVA